MLECVVKVHKKGVVVIPKALREKAGIREGDLIVLKYSDGRIIVEPLERRVTLVSLDEKVVDEILREVDLEEKKLENEKLRRLLRS